MLFAGSGERREVLGSDTGRQQYGQGHGSPPGRLFNNAICFLNPHLCPSIPQCARGHSVLLVSMPFWSPVMALNMYLTQVHIGGLSHYHTNATPLAFSEDSFWVTALGLPEGGAIPACLRFGPPR